MIASWIPEDYLKSIVLFEKPNDKGELQPHGTGVLLLYKNVYIIVTCKHVAMNLQTKVTFTNLFATVNKADGTKSRKSIDAIHSKYSLHWFYHHNDGVDIAVSPVAIEENIDDIKLLTLDLFEDFEQMPVGDEVFFLGYPLGLGIDTVTKLSPLVRGGLISLKLQDKSFLIDANVYPGSSGSPVFYKPVLATRNQTNMEIGHLRALKFLGIVSSSIPSQEYAISAHTGRIRTIFEENSGLGVVQSASIIKEVLDSPEFTAVLPKTEEAQANAENRATK